MPLSLGGGTIMFLCCSSVRENVAEHLYNLDGVIAESIPESN